MRRMIAVGLALALVAGCGRDPLPEPEPDHPRSARLAAGSEAVVSNLDAEGGELAGVVTMTVDGDPERPALDNGTRVLVVADRESVDRDPFRRVEVEVRDGKQRGRKGGVMRLSLEPAK